MAEFKTLEVAGFPAAIMGMRNPLKSYCRADSGVEIIDPEFRPGVGEFTLGPNDYDLAKRLWKAGTEHRKWMRQIQVWVEIYAPRYWWSEADTYSIGVSKNSESTMHRLIKDGVSDSDFEFPWGEGLFTDSSLKNIISDINALIEIYNSENKEDKEKYFLMIKGLLPESFIQKRTVNLNYEVLANMYRQRKNHRLPQWSKDFVNWVKTLPYHEFIVGFEN